LRFDRRLIIGLALLATALFLSACSGNGQVSSGVASIDQSQTTKPEIKSAGPSGQQAGMPVPVALESDNTDLTDEERTTQFTVCLRDHGLNIPDPELNADGSVDLGALKSSFDQGANIKQSPKALDECLPLLEGATFSKKDSAEDEIQLQDDLLAFSQCLRNEGIDVPDPDFSGDPRAGMGAIKGILKGASPRVERGFNLCNERVFGSKTSGK
jgi:hypothetical protein